MHVAAWGQGLTTAPVIVEEKHFPSRSNRTLDFSKMQRNDPTLWGACNFTYYSTVWPEVSHLVEADARGRCTHHHIAPYLAKGADQMSVMIVVHLPQCGSHAGHEAPLENKRKRIQFTIKFKLKTEDRTTRCSRFWCIPTGCVDWIGIQRQAWPPRFEQIGALTQWRISLTG